MQPNEFAPYHQDEDVLMSTGRAQQAAGLARWRAECAGEIEAPPELRDLLAAMAGRANKST